VNEEAAFGDVEVFGFVLVALPGSDDFCVGMADGVESSYAFKGEVVHKADCTAAVGVGVSLNDGFFHIDVLGFCSGLLIFSGDIFIVAE